MSLPLTIYKLSRHRGFKAIPGGWRFRRFCRSLVAGRTYRAKYLQGHVWVHPGNVIADTVLLTGQYEPTTAAIIAAYMSHGYAFVDVGANVGLHTLGAAFARRGMPRPVVAFEPEPSTFALLQRNVITNNLAAVECVGLAIGNREGHVSLHVSNGWNQGAHSLLPREDTSRQLDVPITKLDTYFMAGTREPRNRFLLKVDVEGSEPEVIEGGIEWLGRASDCAVLIEIFPGLLESGHKSPQDIFDGLQSVGFHKSFVVSDSGNGSATFDRDRYFNMLFVKGGDACDLVTAELSEATVTWYEPADGEAHNALSQCDTPTRS